MPDFHGVLPALITPFTEDGADVDPDALAAIVDRLIGAGVAGLVPGGSTGEFTTLTHAERREVIEVTVDAAGREAPARRRREPTTGGAATILGRWRPRRRRAPNGPVPSPRSHRRPAGRARSDRRWTSSRRRCGRPPRPTPPGLLHHGRSA